MFEINEYRNEWIFVLFTLISVSFAHMIKPSMTKRESERMAMAKRSTRRPRQKLGELARQSGTHLCSLGDVEQLAGVNINSDKERGDLWNRFSHLFNRPTQELFDAVMDHCAAIALKRIAGGELCLVRTRW